VIFISLIKLHEHSECPTALTRFFIIFPSLSKRMHEQYYQIDPGRFAMLLSTSALDNHTTERHSDSISKGCTNFSQMWEQRQDSGCQKVGRKHVDT
jgi:hypothetical protein